MFLRVAFIVLYVLALAGQARLDGQEYEYVIEDFSSALPDDFIYSITSDQQGNLLGSTRRGVFIYDGITVEQMDAFQEFDLVQKMDFDKNEMMWFRVEKPKFNTDYDYIQIYDPIQRTFIKLENYCHFIDTRINIHQTFSFTKDLAGDLWINQMNNVFLYKSDSIKFITSRDSPYWFLNFHTGHLSRFEGKKTNIASEAINLRTNKVIRKAKGIINVNNSFIFRDSFMITAKLTPARKTELYDNHGTLLSSNNTSKTVMHNHYEKIYYSYSDQLYIYDKLTGEMESVNESTTGLKGKSILGIETIGETIWLQTDNGLFRTYRKPIDFEHRLTSKDYRVRRFLQVGAKELLIFTDKYMLFYNMESKKITLTNQFHGASNAFLRHDTLLQLSIGGPVEITYKIDIDQHNIKKRKEKIFSENSYIESAIELDSLLIFASFTGITITNKATSKVRVYPVDFTEHIYDIITTNNKNSLFLLCDPGLAEIDVVTKELKVYEELSKFTITAISETGRKANQYWVCTKFGGLILWDRNEGIINRWTKENGLSHNNIHCAYEDNRGRLWMASDYGINVLDIKENVISVLTKQNGLKEIEMNRFAHFRAADSTLFFGSQKGFFSFKPDLYEFQKPDEAVTFRYLKYILPRSDQPKKLDLSLPGSKILIRRSYINPKLILSPSSSGKAQEIRYRFSGNTTWKIVQNNEIDLNSITKSQDLFISRKEGFYGWSPPEIFKVKYQLPLYQRTWFIVSGVLAIAASIILFLSYTNYRRKIINDRIRKEIKIRTLELSENNDELQASKQLNDQIFSIIGHDLRSPIISLNNTTKSIDYLISVGDKDGLKKLSSSIDKNSTSLLKLVDKLLQWAKSQRRTSNTFTKIDMYEEVVKSIFEVAAFSKRKEITIDLVKPIFDSSIDSDSESIQIILRNLLRNSIKFSESKSTISLNIEKDKDLLVTLRDEGIGFSKDTLAKIENGGIVESRIGTHGETGNGIGLSISKELARKLNGSLTISSVQGLGSKFILRLPID